MRKKFVAGQSDDKSDMNQLKKQQDLLNVYRHSTKIYNLQITSLQYALEEKQRLLQQLQSSRSWKITAPIRVLNYLFKRKLPTGHSFKNIKKKTLKTYHEEGIQGVYRKATYVFPKLEYIGRKLQYLYKSPDTSSKIYQTYTQDIAGDKLQLILNGQFTQQDININYPLILIVSEITLPQCYKYRVQQKTEHFKRLGWKVVVVDWRDHVQVLSALQICTQVIFYRVPAFSNVLKQLNEAKRLGLQPWWEVDDLIVDQELYAQCSFMDTLPKAEKDLLHFGADLYRKSMLACDRAIASTKTLAKVMHEAGVKNVVVIENALDKETLRIAEQYYPKPTQDKRKQKDSDKVVILYGSGTSTHNADFLVAADGILAALQKNSNLCLWIVGELELPVNFQTVAQQVKYIPTLSYERYLGVLAQADIAIAPLEPIIFNDAKSNIKYLEASILGIPSVCSDRAAFVDVITDQENGFLACNSAEWEEKLLCLANNIDLRKKMGEAAYQTIIKRYLPETITEQQVRPVFGNPQFVSKNKLKVLVVNIHYDPYSFGGATIVAEEMVKRLQQVEDVEVSIFTSRPFKDSYQGLRRYKSQGSVVYSVDLTPSIHDTTQFNNLEIVEPFDAVLDAVKPDIVHFHAIQNLGVQMLFSCQSLGIPYIVTLHDSWWLCNRQFMVKADRKYCFQTKIDLQVCQSCEIHARHLTERMVMMKQGLQEASLLLSPSETHRQLFIANGIHPDLIKVHSNGIDRSMKERPTRNVDTPLRFGFVAGDEVIKGYQVIKQAFESLHRSDWELYIIDSKVHMGHPPIDIREWQVSGKVATVPPYNEQTKDDFFYDIDVLLFPSQWKESYGMTVREALLRDVWVICSHPGGQSEAVIDGVNGTYISLDGDAIELKKAVEALLDKASMFNHYENPYKDNIETFEHQAETLLEYYRWVRGQ
ncbi:glycosyltransferase [Commensalibacter oyaizuii]|uniref:Glycosyltransferase n=1 Tax=Commensalibacter oyaizuii TaxID=3043873 RepID=A0ABT6Q186_9PROT|nr:glycosyltransferase [Commensalibacter sp. TBRC 16381]MDI2090874.1 glycosyltransferase [Commensalibacter sp. TBRC 16381]